MYSNQASTSTDRHVFYLKRSLLLTHVAQFCCCFTQLFLYAYIISFIPADRGQSNRLIGVCALASASLGCACLYVYLYPRHKPKPVHLTRISRLIDAYIMFPLAIAQIVVLRDSSLPYNCYGLTRQNWSSGDLPNKLKPGYATIRFGNGMPDGAGELDYLCPEAQAGFGLAAASLILSFISFVLTTKYLHRLASTRIVTPKFDLETQRTGSMSSQAPMYLEVHPLSELRSAPSTTHVAIELPSPVLTTATLPSTNSRVSDMKRAQMESPTDLRGTVGDAGTSTRVTNGTEQPPPYTVMDGGERSTA